MLTRRDLISLDFVLIIIGKRAAHLRRRLALLFNRVIQTLAIPPKMPLKSLNSDFQERRVLLAVSAL